MPSDNTKRSIVFEDNVVDCNAKINAILMHLEKCSEYQPY